MRYSNTERIGIIETQRTFTKEIDWIFREQPIDDFGVDAIIEEVKNHDPTGRLLASQIKSGYGNFHITNKGLTFYVSNVHYNYWLGYVIPIIMIAYLPDSNTLLWELISESTLKRTKDRWKIDIPKNKVLGKTSKTQLTEILDKRFRYVSRPEPLIGDPLNIDIDEIVQDIKEIKDATESTKNFIAILGELKTAADNETLRLNQFATRGLSDQDKEVIASINQFADDLLAYAKRIKDEIKIFSESFGTGFSAYMQVATIYSMLTSDNSEIEENKVILQNVLIAIAEAYKGIKTMQDSVKRLPKKYTRLKHSRNLLVESIDLVLSEYKIAESFLKNAINNNC